MGANSKIEWTHHTFNPWRGCTKVSAGCANCYAERQSLRNPKVLGIWGDDGTRVIAAESYWKEPLKWNQAAKAAGERHRVFCASLADWLEDRAELVQPRARLCGLIEETPWLDYLLLSKRLENFVDLVPARWLVGEMPRNVWIGTSTENQKTFDERWPLLEKIGRHHGLTNIFLSIEPLIGPLDIESAVEEVDFGRDWPELSRTVDWVIVGGESGPHARPMHPIWVRDLRDQCVGSGSSSDIHIPFFFKQWGEYQPVMPFEEENGDPDLIAVDLAGVKYSEDEDPPFEKDAWMMKRVGKHAAGRLLDGREWSEFPVSADIPA